MEEKIMKNRSKVWEFIKDYFDTAGIIASGIYEAFVKFIIVMYGLNSKSDIMKLIGGFSLVGTIFALFFLICVELSNKYYYGF